MSVNNSAIASGDWGAPTLSGPADASALVEIPGSKSLTNRYLLLAALAETPSLIHAPCILGMHS